MVINKLEFNLICWTVSMQLITQCKRTFNVLESFDQCPDFLLRAASCMTHFIGHGTTNGNAWAEGEEGRAW